MTTNQTATVRKMTLGPRCFNCHRRESTCTCEAFFDPTCHECGLVVRGLGESWPAGAGGVVHRFHPRCRACGHVGHDEHGCRRNACACRRTAADAARAGWLIA